MKIAFKEPKYINRYQIDKVLGRLSDNNIPIRAALEQTIKSSEDNDFRIFCLTWAWAYKYIEIEEAQDLIEKYSLVKIASRKD